MTTTCSTCLQYSKQQSKEPLHPHNVPSFPWQKVGTDLLEYKGAQYLLVADYYSKYPILRKLNGTTSNAVINQLKSIFAEYGIPETLVSDNGPQYSSREFSTFCSHWGIGHSTSSPLYPRSNGFVERMVQTVKNLLCKSEAAGEDPYLALLTYRTTPVDNNLPSPAKLLNQREYRTLLPCSGRLQRCQTTPANQEQLQLRQDVQKRQHDVNSPRVLSKLLPEQKVVVFQPRKKTWTPGKVIQESNKPRSYVVETPNGGEVRRNRIHLKPVIEDGRQPEIDHMTSGQDCSSSSLQEKIRTSEPNLEIANKSRKPETDISGDDHPVTTRSGRIIKKPTRLNL
ncbi:Transposon Ty3-I Gag-Pol poly [Paramuricea clavata]|uniref:Transposon Ty3-I Gag-Pol poly n=1 Tax=Paramuricea clavata TaxID=317549 RepID=A0A6S7LSF7_PARCT|nr:Transposon Ty3-I Gag-Pol poly [Paramuricea clavata]